MVEVLKSKFKVCGLSFLFFFLISSTAISQTPEEIYNLAIKYYKAADYKKASQYLEEYVKIRPEPQAYYLLGYSYYKLKLFERAEAAFNEAYLIDPELVPPRLEDQKDGEKTDGAQR
ncbi:MAG: tetratricopeptide repeat protein [Thermodesulfovibrionales bacterium]|nr:tetratricopeptide repeat protein [Thermodesulfovibrionales bacterium]